MRPRSKATFSGTFTTGPTDRQRTNKIGWIPFYRTPRSVTSSITMRAHGEIDGSCYTLQAGRTRLIRAYILRIRRGDRYIMTHPYDTASCMCRELETVGVAYTWALWQFNMLLTSFWNMRNRRRKKKLKILIYSYLYIARFIGSYKNKIMDIVITLKYNISINVPMRFKTRDRI